jgi:hypothetical protein
MKHPEATYINAGHAYERAKAPAATQSAAQRIYIMLKDEQTEDRAEARRLVEVGRAEARR